MQTPKQNRMMTRRLTSRAQPALQSLLALLSMLLILSKQPSLLSSLRHQRNSQRPQKATTALFMIVRVPLQV